MTTSEWIDRLYRLARATAETMEHPDARACSAQIRLADERYEAMITTAAGEEVARTAGTLHDACVELVVDVTNRHMYLANGSAHVRNVGDQIVAAARDAR